MKKLTGFIVKLLPLGLLLGLCIALSGCGKMQRINLNDLMSYEITGYSGQGKLTWDLDDQKFAEQLLSGRTEAEAWSMLYRAGSSVNGTWSKEEGLSNGDVITFRWTYNPDVLKKDYKVILEAEDLTVTVQGLPDGSLDLDSENYDYYIGNFDTIDTLPEQLFGWDMGYGYRYPDNAFTSLVLSRTDEYKYDEMVLE